MTHSCFDSWGQSSTGTWHVRFPNVESKTAACATMLFSKKGNALQLIDERRRRRSDIPIVDKVCKKCEYKYKQSGKGFWN